MTAKVLTGDIWGSDLVRRAVARANNRIYCIAYVTRYLPWMFKKGDVLVCDAGRHAVEMGETDAKIIARIRRRGVKVYSRTALHVKCAILGNCTLVGSANLSESSARVLQEVSVLQDDPLLSSQLKNLVERILKDGITEEVDDVFQSELSGIKVVREGGWQAGFSTERRSRSVSKLGVSNWLMSVHAAVRSPAGEDERANRVASLLAKSRKQSSLWRDSEVFWYRTTDNQTLRRVRPNDRIIMVDHNDYRIPGRADVLAPGIVLKVKRSGEHVYVYYTRGKKSISLANFRKHLRVRTAFSRKLSNNPNRKLTDKQFEALAGVFE